MRDPPSGIPSRGAALALLLGLGGGTGLVLAEVGLRVAGFGPDVGLFTVTEQEFRDIPGMFGPNQHRVEARGSDFQHEVTINNLGYRGTERVPEEAAGEIRILFVGDSFTWGHNVSDGETLPAQLESSLRASCGPVTVLNAGISGTSILAHEAMVERGMAVEPDLVFLMYHENDIGELIDERMWERLAANRQTKSRFPVSFLYPLVRSSALWQLAQNARRRVQMAGPVEPPHTPPTSSATPDEPVLRARQEYAARLEHVRDLLGRRGVPFGFVAFPHPESVSGGSGGRDYDWVLGVAEDMGIITLDLLPVIRGAGAPVEALFLVPEDYHPSPEGYAVAARAVTRMATSLHPGLSARCEVNR